MILDLFLYGFNPSVRLYKNELVVNAYIGNHQSYPFRINYRLDVLFSHEEEEYAFTPTETYSISDANFYHLEDYPIRSKIVLQMC